MSIFQESAPDMLHDTRESHEEAHGASKRGLVGVTCALEPCPSSFCISRGITNDTKTFCAG